MFDARKEQLRAIKANLVQFNSMLNDVEQNGDTKKPDAMARFISDAAHTARMIEQQVDILLGNVRLTPEPKPSKMKRLLYFVFPILRIK